MKPFVSNMAAWNSLLILSCLYCCCILGAERTYRFSSSFQTQAGFIIAIDPTSYERFLDSQQASSSPNTLNKTLYLDFSGEWDLSVEKPGKAPHAPDIDLTIWVYNKTYPLTSRPLWLMGISWNSDEPDKGMSCESTFQLPGKPLKYHCDIGSTFEWMVGTTEYTWKTEKEYNDSDIRLALGVQFTESNYDFVLATKASPVSPERIYWSLRTERYYFGQSNYTLLSLDSYNNPADGLEYYYYPSLELVEAAKLPPVTPQKSTTPDEWLNENFPIVGLIVAVLIVALLSASLIALAIRQCRKSPNSNNIIRGDGYIVEDGVVYGSVSGDSSIPQLIQVRKRPIRKRLQEFIQRTCSCCIPRRRGWLSNGRFQPVVGPSDYELERVKADEK